MLSADEIIRKLHLLPHPEGGYFKEIYRSEEIISKPALPERYNGARNISTSIYYMLNKDQSSKFHRIKSDEIWHFYLGSPLKLYTINSEGKLKEIILGTNLEANEIPQYKISAGDWFAAELEDKNSFALFGCTVAPGFDFSDFELADRQELIKSFPQHKQLIESLA